jgi:hypothetical protein
MYNIKDRNFFPKDFVRFAQEPASGATTLTTGDSLVSGATYVITTKPTGGTPAFDGCSLIEVGVVFTASGTSATWGTTTAGVLTEIVNSGGKTVQTNYYDKNGLVNMIWYTSYNSDDECIGWFCTDGNGLVINQSGN